MSYDMPKLWGPLGLFRQGNFLVDSVNSMHTIHTIHTVKIKVFVF